MIPASEGWLERERDQIPLWLPIALGAGITGWFVIPVREGWIALMLASAGLAVVSLLADRRGRTARAGTIGLLAIALGTGLIWWRAERVAAPRLDWPRVVRFVAQVKTVDDRPAEQRQRLLLVVQPGSGLPPLVRVNVDTALGSVAIRPGSTISIRARLVPPPEAALPGAYDFSRIAWFQGIGATGKAIELPTVLRPASPGGPVLWLADVRARLSAHIHNQLAGSPGGIAAALVTGDQGAIAKEDADAMRMSGLARLLSISGLHVGVVVGGVMLLSIRIMSLSRWLALRMPLPLFAAAAAAIAGIGYTLIAGAEVPTVRSCIASLLILMALAIGREALTLRLVASGALCVLLVWPEALAGPSFQLSFAAITALVSLHELPWVKARLARRDEGMARRLARSCFGLLLTGIVIELALTPIALFHFHRTGIYGAVANMAAIPLTTFVIMPVEALALLLDLAGAGAPFWWLAGAALQLLIDLAHGMSLLPGAVAAVPQVPAAAFALFALGGLCLGLWRTRARLVGLPLILIGAIWVAATPVPELLITGEGRHVAFRSAGRGMVLLRPRAREYVRKTIGEISGVEAAAAIDDLPGARCSADICRVDLLGGGRLIRLLATRSGYPLEWLALREACADADIVVSDRMLPKACKPRWIRADPRLLRRTGGLAINLSTLSIRTVRVPIDDHPWRQSAPRHVRRDRGERKGNGTAVAGKGDPDAVEIEAADARIDRSGSRDFPERSR